MFRPPLLMSALLLPLRAVESPDRAQVVGVVQKFLDALAARDAVTLQALMLPGTQITSARPVPEGLSVRRRVAEDDAKRLPTGSDRLLERMWNPTVLIQGRIATVWTPYDFHTNGTFSHSGIDVFILLKTAEGWRIAGLAYTVEPEVPSAHPAGAPKP